MSSSLVSVVIPTYNRAALLSESIDSVLAQDFKDLELIVVDDGSTDSTKDVLRKYDGKVVSVYQENSGFASARTRGVEMAKGDLVAFHDSDDLMMTGRISGQVDFMNQHQEIAAVSGAVVVEGKEDLDYFSKCGVDFNNKDYVIYEKAFEKLLALNFMIDPASMIRKKAFLDVGGYDLSLRTAADWDLWLKMSINYPLACMRKVCTRLRPQADSLSDSEIQAGALIKIIDRHLNNAVSINSDLEHSVKNKLYHLIAYYIVLNLNNQLDPNWRESARVYARHLTTFQRVLVGAASRLPRCLRFLLNILRSF